MTRDNLLLGLVVASLLLSLANLVLAWPRTKLARLKLEREQREEQDA